MFKVVYKYSACIKIITDDVKILCDPWFSQNAYSGTWTQFPEVQNLKKFIGDFDIIYISHIHPDHYCKDTLKKLFKEFGNKKILIADWGESNVNYLEKKLISDGFGDYLITKNKRTIGDTEINIIPNKTFSKSDIDTALIVSSISLRKSVLNINDCIYNEKHFDSILKLKTILNTEFSLFCLGYTGAGPYPQTYYSPIKEKDILIKKAEEKKLHFFERYIKAIKKIPSKRRLPFAGKYLLKGDFSILNEFRGVADALEIKKFDKDAIILDDGGQSFYDLEKDYVSKERSDFYNYPKFVHTKKDYFWRESIKFEPSENLLKRLLIESAKRAHIKSECDSNCYFSFYAYQNPSVLQDIFNSKKPYKKMNSLITINCNKDTEPFMVEKIPKIHSHLFIESKALFAVLTGICHWNNYEIGSAFQVRRIPDLYDRSMSNYLNFFSVI